MGVIKELNTTIKLRYDVFSAWVSNNPKPEAGEVCIVVIPTNSPQQPDYTVGLYPSDSGLTPYAIGLKVGDGQNYFNNLPWIQAIAGDVYNWAKQSSPPAASAISAVSGNTTVNVQAILDVLQTAIDELDAADIPVVYNSGDSDLQTAITGIEQSLGNIVAQGVDPSTLGTALAQLQEQLAGQTATIFVANQSGVTYKIDTLTQNGLNISATSSPLTVSDISGLIFNRQLNANNHAATMDDLTALRTDILASIPTAVRFRGVSSSALTDGGTEYPTINNIEITSVTEGDIFFYGDKEFIWDGSSWEQLGDETSGGVAASDLDDIAFNGEVRHLKQTDATILVFDCGNATNNLYD